MATATGDEHPVGVRCVACGKVLTYVERNARLHQLREKESVFFHGMLTLCFWLAILLVMGVLYLAHRA